MNILFIDRALPSSPFSGKTVRLKNIYGRLAQKEKIVYLRTSEAGLTKESEELEAWAQKTFSECLRLRSPGGGKLLNKVRAVLKLRPWYDLRVKHPGKLEQITSDLEYVATNHDIDLVVTFDNEAAEYGLLLSKRIPWIQDLGDSMVLQLRRQRDHAPSIKRKIDLFLREIREAPFEKEMAERASSTIFVAADDAGLYQTPQSPKICVIANGVDTGYFDSGSIEPVREDKPYIIFTGHMSFAPNQDAVLHFVESIFPILRRARPDIAFKVVGADPSPVLKSLAQNQGFEVTGNVPDIRPYLAGASAFVCPMRTGSGIKNKILEALAMGIPVVATPLAVAGIEDLPKGLVPVAAKPAEFAEKLIAIINDPAFRKHAAPQGRDFVQKNYAWQDTVDKYTDLFSNLCGRLMKV